MTTKLEHWLRKIDEHDIPIFKSTVNALLSIGQGDEASASELAGVILRDPSLSAKILKFANSSYYNPAQTKTYTISRAVVLMGFDVVRDIGLSLAIIESLLATKKREVVSSLMAKSFHAATQAQNIAKENGETALEEVFLAALLNNLGEMAFWCVVEDDLAEKLLEAMNEDGVNAEEVQENLLGFKLADLTDSLVEKWNLKKESGDSSHGKPSKTNLTKYVDFGVKLAEALPTGFESDKARKICRQLAGQLGISLAATQKIVKEGAQKAAEVANSYGASSLAPLMPGYSEFSGSVRAEEVGGEGEDAGKTVYPEPNPLLQLKILRDLSVILKSSKDLNLILENLLEGIYLGIGLDRALFALFYPLKSQIRGKFVAGVNTESLFSNFTFSVGDVTKNPFNQVLLEKPECFWMKEHMFEDYSDIVMKKIVSVLSVKNFFLAPLIVGGKPIGLFYADRQPSRRPLDTESFESFEHFAHQASMAIGSLTLGK